MLINLNLKKKHLVEGRGQGTGTEPGYWETTRQGEAVEKLSVYELYVTSVNILRH